MELASDFSPGQIVRSKAGRDKDHVFFVVGTEGSDIVLIADGDLRKIDHPKKKKAKHLQPYHLVSEEIRSSLEKGKRPENIELQKELKRSGVMSL